MVNHFVKDNESFHIGGIKVTGTTSVRSQLTQQDYIPLVIHRILSVFMQNKMAPEQYLQEIPSSLLEVVAFLKELQLKWTLLSIRFQLPFLRTLKFTYSLLVSSVDKQPGHEYTLSNCKFAESVSSAEAIQKLIQECKTNKVTTGRFTIGDEKTWNVFMRLDVSSTSFPLLGYKLIFRIPKFRKRQVKQIPSKLWANCER